MKVVAVLFLLVFAACGYEAREEIKDPMGRKATSSPYPQLNHHLNQSGIFFSYASREKLVENLSNFPELSKVKEDMCAFLEMNLACGENSSDKKFVVDELGNGKLKINVFYSGFLTKQIDTDTNLSFVCSDLICAYF